LVVTVYLVEWQQVAVVVQQVAVSVWCHPMVVVSLQVAAADLAAALQGVPLVQPQVRVTLAAW
jgi:hypothetical protein